MPGGDRTGPEGFGPRTGRAIGYCAGYSSPGFTKGVPRGRGFGRGRGRGFRSSFWERGRGFWRSEYYPEPYLRESYSEHDMDEKTYLQDMIKSLEDELKAVKQRLQEISKDKKDSQ